jgi:hypothetical protein
MHPSYSKYALTSRSSLINFKIWVLDPTLFPLHVPFLMLWEVAMVRRVFVLRAVGLARAQGSNIDQLGLAKRTTNNA